jgi:phosphoribosyl 1,2-cyclic phosphate phosphodiesterase
VGLPEMILHTIDQAEFKVGDIPFLPIHVMHREMPVLGFRIGDLSYITDANYISAEEKEKVKGSKILILNALRKQDHPTHFNLKQAIALATELKVPTVYFIHFSHQIGLHDDVEASLPAGMHLAYDGLEFDC